MYIIEVINRLLKSKKRPEPQTPEEFDVYEKCEHIFVPLDSTEETLACSKCGLVVKKNEMLKKKRNFFE